MNEQVFEPIKNKQLLCKAIYTSDLLVLKFSKAYIETYLKTKFIQFLQTFISVLILFHKKPDESFCSCINYQDLNNSIIKNRYFLFLIEEYLNWLN